MMMVRKMCKITGHDHLWEFNKCTKKDTGFAQSARPFNGSGDEFRFHTSKKDKLLRWLKNICYSTIPQSKRL